MSDEAKIIDIREFRAKGYLQELNRQFLHPLGMALSVVLDDVTGEETFGGIIDCRDDPEGFMFARIPPEEAMEKAKAVQAEQDRFAGSRSRKFGWVIQPVENMSLTAEQQDGER